MNPTYIIENLNKETKYRIDVHDLKKVLEGKKGLKKEKRHRYNTPAFLDKHSRVSWLARNDRPYIFNVKDWLNEEQLKEFETLDITPELNLDENRLN